MIAAHTMKCMFLFLLAIASASAGANASYVISRVIYDVCSDDDCRTIDTKNAEGTAWVTDTGAFTPIDRLQMDVYACPMDCSLDEGEVYFSPAPSCPCLDVVFDGGTDHYTADGRVYTFDAMRISILRRGSVETGDPSLIVRFDDGTILIYREQ
jgi:hypothetical protein